MVASPDAGLPPNVLASESHAGLSRAFGVVPATSFSYRRGHDLILANVRYIPEFGWYLVVEQAENGLTADVTRTLLINLAVCALITAVVLGLVKRAVRAYQERIETLRGIVPICSYCKKIRDDQGYWNQVEAYVSRHTQAEFSHGICPDCLQQHYPEMVAQYPDIAEEK